MKVQKDIELYRNRPEPLSWKIPAFCCNDWTAMKLLHICKELNAEKPFDIVYGAPLCAWSGGRPSAISGHLSEKDLATYFSAYKQFDVTCALTLSRLAVAPEELGDPYCNLLLDIIEEYEGEAIVYDDVLAAYIKKTHPKVKTVASLNKAMCDFSSGFEGCADETTYYLRLLELYDEVVIRCEYASDDDKLFLLNDVSDRLEIIVNQFCIPECPNVYRHLSAIERWNDNGQKGYCQQCFSLEKLSSMENRLSLNLFMSDSRIDELVSGGFTRLKLAGRNLPVPQFLDMLSHYIFEPTGAISIIGNEIIKEYRAHMMRTEGRFRQYELPPQENAC